MPSNAVAQSSAFAVASSGPEVFVTRLLVSGLCEAVWAVDNGRAVKAARIREEDPRVDNSAWCTLLRDPQPFAIRGEHWWLIGMSFLNVFIPLLI